jgi:hypothetical protein
VNCRYPARRRRRRHHLRRGAGLTATLVEALLFRDVDNVTMTLVAVGLGLFWLSP